MSSCRPSIYSAAEHGDLERLKYLIQKNPSLINRKSKKYTRYEKTPLHITIENYQRDCILFLIENGADVNAQDISNLTPLHYVVSGRRDKTIDLSDIFELLPQKGANIEAKTLDYDTPLHVATYTNNPKYVRLLLENGANIEAKNVYDNKAIDLASRHQPVKEILEEWIDMHNIKEPGCD